MNGHQADNLTNEWERDERWQGVKRNYGAEDVLRLRGSLHIEYTLARRGAERLWSLLQSEPYVAALGALTGNQAVQQVKAGLQAIYLSGWQVAADANQAGQMYPDQSLYPSNSVPMVVRKINQALQRADQIQHSEGRGDKIDWFAPIIADGEAGFGGPLNVFEMTKAMIEAGAAGVHFEDQLASEKKCGHMGGKVLIPTQTAIKHLSAARLAADIMNVPTILIARTDANAAQLITSDIDPADQPFLTGERTPEGFYRIHSGLDTAIARGLAYAPYCDLIWCETSEICRRHSASQTPFTSAIPASSWLIIARLHSIGARNWTKQPSVPSSSSSGRWATSSSLLRWPASTPSITACSSWLVNMLNRA
ncbi:hypothetical protein KDK_51070 [Dictyobacter kobayashii]|uniref:Isocitrate lyase n=1 Tax=Dictyobacter kobayashii TaxID=2014872 RepID=A0A402AQA9_9CHLR|nr:hypothetical protein KDK_51070 [Dictyobacter kobayashii]